MCSRISRFLGHKLTLKNLNITYMFVSGKNMEIIDRLLWKGEVRLVEHAAQKPKIRL